MQRIACPQTKSVIFGKSRRGHEMFALDRDNSQRPLFQAGKQGHCIGTLL